MKADDFINFATDPDEWVERSANLRKSGDVIWESLIQSKNEYADSKRRGDPDEDKLDECVGYLSTAHMLYGLAVETALKAHLFREQPEQIEFQVVADGDGEAVEASIKKLGVSISNSHDLSKLAHAADLFDQDHLFNGSEDYDRMENILDQLTDSVLWAARYPVHSIPMETVPGQKILQA